MRSAWVVCMVAMLACRPSPRPIGGDESALPPNRGPRPGVLADAREAEGERRTEPEDDGWCDQLVHEFASILGEQPSLGDVLPTAEEVIVMRPELRESDCSGVGYSHVSFVPFDTEAHRLQRGYASQQLPAMLPDKTPLYLVGAHRVSPRRVDLNRVCISFSETVTLDVDWIFPIAAEEEVAGIQRRINDGACGRLPVGCEQCSPECGTEAPGCCQYQKDSCPGPAGRNSTCVRFLPCDERCCP